MPSATMVMLIDPVVGPEVGAIIAACTDIMAASNKIKVQSDFIVKVVRA
jgi:hypothetical protein